MLNNTTSASVAQLGLERETLTPEVISRLRVRSPLGAFFSPANFLRVINNRLAKRASTSAIFANAIEGKPPLSLTEVKNGSTSFPWDIADLLSTCRNI